MSDDRGLLQAVCEFPTDDLPRLAFADWLEEQGDERAVCPTCHGKNWSKDWKGGSCPTCWNTPHSVNLLIDGTRRDRAEFIRVQCRIATLADLSGHPKTTPLAWSCKCDVCEEAKPLRRRERELFIAAGPGQLKWFGSLQAVIPVGTPVSSLLPWFRRGFIAEIRLPLDDFLKHAAAIFTNHPIERVVLTDREPHFEIEWYDGDRRKADGILNAIHPESDLPTVLFDLLEGHSTYFRYVDMKSYSPEKTKVKPMDALSNACVAYGRSLTWDKAPGKRIKDIKGKVGKEV